MWGRLQASDLGARRKEAQKVGGIGEVLRQGEADSWSNSTWPG